MRAFARNDRPIRHVFTVDGRGVTRQTGTGNKTVVVRHADRVSVMLEKENIDKMTA